MDAIPRIWIDRLSISGTDATTAKAPGLTIEKVLGEAALAGRLDPHAQRTLRLNLKAGADARTIVCAAAHALGNADRRPDNI